MEICNHCSVYVCGVDLEKNMFTLLIVVETSKKNGHSIGVNACCRVEWEGDEFMVR